jgi:cytosine/adenosine deaminase-related metal-dependent hydrolase
LPPRQRASRRYWNRRPRIATLGENFAPSLSNRVQILDMGGDLVLPDLVDGHMHLGKTLMDYRGCRMWRARPE